MSEACQYFWISDASCTPPEQRELEDRYQNSVDFVSEVMSLASPPRYDGKGIVVCFVTARHIVIPGLTLSESDPSLSSMSSYRTVVAEQNKRQTFVSSHTVVGMHAKTDRPGPVSYTHLTLPTKRIV